MSEHPDQPAEVPEVDPGRAEVMREAGALLLDVREDDEWHRGHIDGSAHTPLGDLDPAALDAGRTVITVCGSGGRAARAAAQLRAAGREALVMSGGLHAWTDTGLPLVSDDGSPGSL